MYSFVDGLSFLLQRVLGDPKNTLKAYWPKIQSFLLWKAKQRLANAVDLGQGSTVSDNVDRELHSRDCLIDACDYLAFMSGVEQGTAGLGITSRGKQLLM